MQKQTIALLNFGAHLRWERAHAIEKALRIDIAAIRVDVTSIPQTSTDFGNAVARCSPDVKLVLIHATPLIDSEHLTGEWIEAARTGAPSEARIVFFTGSDDHLARLRVATNAWVGIVALEREFVSTLSPSDAQLIRDLFDRRQPARIVDPIQPEFLSMLLALCEAYIAHWIDPQTGKAHVDVNDEDAEALSRASSTSGWDAYAERMKSEGYSPMWPAKTLLNERRDRVAAPDFWRVDWPNDPAAVLDAAWGTPCEGDGLDQVRTLVSSIDGKGTLSPRVVAQALVPLSERAWRRHS